MPLLHRTFIVLILFSFLQACAKPSTAAEQLLGDSELREASGLAASRIAANRLWLLNDGDHKATLYALNSRGEPLARLKLRGKRNRDWEDLASFNWRNKPWLLVADIGDNSAKHATSTLHFVEEPKLPKKFKKLKLKPVISVKFSYPDGPRDAEAIAYDPLNEQILILTKRDRPGKLYTLSIADLFSSPKKKHIAQLVGDLPWAGELPSLANLLLNPKRAVSHGMATAMDISDNGLQAVVLGYQQAVLLRRNSSQTWAQATRQALPPHRLEQAEAIGFSRDNQTVYITSEGKNAPLIKQRLPQ